MNWRGHAGVIGEIAILAVLYAAMGDLGLKLAIPPGYATILWPPSGIALAAVLLRGPRIWPGIMLGSYLLNLWTGGDQGAFSILSLAIPAAIGGAAALQALAGWALLRRFGGYPNALTELSQIARLYLLGGLLACLINSSFSVALLHVTGRIATENIAYNWATWWAGDTIGVFIFSPILLVWWQKGPLMGGRRALMTSMSVLVAFAVTVALVAATLRAERLAIGRQVEHFARDQVGSLEKILEADRASILSVQSLFGLGLPIGQDEFQRFTAALRRDQPSLAVLEWIPKVSLDRKDAFETEMRAGGMTAFAIRPLGDGNEKGPLWRDDLFPVLYADPFEENRAAIGFDLASDPARRDMLERSLDGAALSFSAPVRLVQDSRLAVLAASPVFGKVGPGGSAREKMAALRGFALGVIRVEPLIAGAFKGLDANLMHYWLFDETDPLDPVRLAANDPGQPAAYSFTGRSLFSSRAMIGVAIPHEIGGRRWVLHLAPTQTYIGRHFSRDAWLILLGGLTLSGLVGAFALVVTGRERALIAEVAARTRDLQKSEERYRDLFAQSPQPMWLFDETTLAFLDVNQAAVDLYGYSREEFAAMTLDDVRPPEDMERFRRSIDDKDFELRLAEARHRKKDGGVIDVKVWTRRLSGAKGPCRLSLLLDITAAKHAEEALKASEEVARALLNATVDAAFLVDRSGALLAANQAMAARFGTDPAKIVGRSVFSLIDGALSEARRQEFEQVFKDAKPLRVEDERDGLILDNILYPVPGLDGNVAQVAVFSRDITENTRIQKRIDRLLVYQRALLDNTPLGIGVFTLDRLCIEANEEFSRIYGVRRDEIVGRSAKRLYRDPDQYEELGNKAYPLILAGGTFREDVPMRHGDGREIWVRLSARMIDIDAPELGAIWSAEDITERKEMELSLKRLTAELERLVRTDALTGLANRRVLDEAASAELLRCKRFGSQAALLMIDIDHFKLVNDRHGHETGDKALVALGAVLSDTARGTDLAVRFGGEEFVILLAGTDIDGAIDMSERIRSAVSRISISAHGENFGFTVSVGVTIYSSQDAEWTDVLRRADQALYQAKNAGRNRISVIRPERPMATA